MPPTNSQSKPHFSILATSFAGGPPPRRTAIIVFGLWFLLFFAALFTPPLLDDADATHAQAARAMATTGDLVTLRVDGVRYLEKAPLPYWLAAASFKVFGFNTFAAHLPQALAVLLLALLGYRWANQAFGSRTGFYTALGVLTSAGVFLFTRILIPEVLLSLCLAAAFFAFLKCLGPIAPDAPPSSVFRRHPEQSEGPPHSGAQITPEAVPLERPSVAWYAGPLFYPYVMWASLALAVLSKGLVAIVFFFATTLAFLLLTDQLRDWRKLRPFTGLLLFLAIAAPWHILAGLRNQGGAGGHGFWWFYFWNEHVLRFLGHRIPRDYNKMPGWLYWSSHLLWLFPWTLFVPLGITALWRRRQHQQLLTTKPLKPGSPGGPPETWENSPRNFSAEAHRASEQERPRRFFSTRDNYPSDADLFGLVSVCYIGLYIWKPNLLSYAVVCFAVIVFLGLIIRRLHTGLTASPFHRIDPQQRTILLLSLFAAIVLLFFSLSTNQEYYTFPAYLPLLLLIAATITRAEQTYSTNPSAVRWVTFAHAAFMFLGLAGAIALIYGLIASAHLPYNPDLGTVLAHRGVGSYTLATSHLFDLTTAAFAGLRFPAVLAALALLFGPAAAWALRAQRRHLAATTFIAFTAAAFLVAAHLAFARFAPILSSQSFVPTIQQLCNKQSCAQTTLAIFGDQAFGSSLPFYLGAPVPLVDGKSTSMLFGSTFPDPANRIFVSNADLLHAWHSPTLRVLLFVPAERRYEALHLLPPNPIILKEESGKLLLTNHP